MRVHGQPAAVTAFEDDRGATGAGEGAAVRTGAERVPRANRPGQVAGQAPVEFVEAKGELADIRPDVAPLLAAQVRATGGHPGKCAEADHIRREDALCALIVYRAHAGLQLT